MNCSRKDADQEGKYIFHYFSRISFEAHTMASPELFTRFSDVNKFAAIFSKYIYKARSLLERMIQFTPDVAELLFSVILL